MSFPHLTVGDTLTRNQSAICTGGLVPEVYVPNGRTEIYSPQSQTPSDAVERKLVVVAGFCISEDEISVGTYQSCILDDFCSPLSGNQDDPNHPVHSITYDDVEQFLLWLNSKSHLEYRLPSEAEWQYAALGGMEDRFPWREVGRLPEVNIFSGEITPIGKNSVNEFGLRDAVGNLSEIVAGCGIAP